MCSLETPAVLDRRPRTEIADELAAVDRVGHAAFARHGAVASRVRAGRVSGVSEGPAAVAVVRVVGLCVLKGRVHWQAPVPERAEKEGR